MVLEHYKTELELAQYVSKLEAQVKGYKALCERLQAQADEMRGGRAVEPEGWREFIADCAGTAGGMVNGNRLSMRAAELLASAPTPTNGVSHD